MVGISAPLSILKAVVDLQSSRLTIHGFLFGHNQFHTIPRNKYFHLIPHFECFYILCNLVYLLSFTTHCKMIEFVTLFTCLSHSRTLSLVPVTPVASCTLGR